MRNGWKIKASGYVKIEKWEKEIKLIPISCYAFFVNHEE